MHTHQQEHWLQTVFQNSIQLSLQLMNSSAPEETPYFYKYEAIETLRKLNEVDHPYKFILQCVLGELYTEVDQPSDSARSYESALKEFSRLSPSRVPLFYEYLLVIYNMLGLCYTNREQQEQGLGCLVKAYQLYQLYSQNQLEDCYHNRFSDPKGRVFKCYYEGGNDKEQVEDSFTLTLFYLAQAYTKLELKDKAAQYCGMTLQRQHANQKYQIKDFCLNLIGLSEYYQGSQYFAQAQYILLLALKVLPQNRNKKLRATIWTSLGKLLCEMLDYSCKCIEKQVVMSPHIGEQVLTFNDVELQFPKITLPSELQGCKVLFRQANTQLKKALEVFVLDGFVTEHIELLFTQSKLYKALSLLEKSVERRISMLQKRRELLEPLLKELNPKAYPSTWQKILVETSQILNDNFTLRVALIGGKGVPNEEKINQSRQIGKRTIGYYKEIIRALLENKEVQKDEQYYRSIVNSRINIAKAWAKLLSTDRKERVEHMKEAWREYQAVIQFVQNSVPVQLQAAFHKEVQLTQEMIALMPSKIDRINYGQMHYLEA